jgi:putative membrane protein
MAIKLFAPAVVTCLSLTTMVRLTPAVAQATAQHTALASDSSFIQEAGSLGLLQVKLGKLAQEKGSSEVVRDFGKRMVADYSKANEELAAGAKQAAYPRPVLLRTHQQIFARFNDMSRSAFDKSYMAEMVSEHDEMAGLFENEAKDGRVQSLEQLASGMLPAVQQHQALATQTASSVGADVTATTSQARKGS